MRTVCGLTPPRAINDGRCPANQKPSLHRLPAVGRLLQHSYANPSGMERALEKAFWPRYNSMTAGGAFELFALIRHHNIDRNVVQRSWIRSTLSDDILTRAPIIRAEWVELAASLSPEQLPNPTSHCRWRPSAPSPARDLKVLVRAQFALGTCF